jgi:hypothetical protein
MWWRYKKLSETETTVVYAYSRDSKELTGELLYEKTTGDYSVLKVADNDNDGLAKWALSHFSKVIKKGFPDKDMVAIG